MHDELSSLSYNGEWKDVLALLGQQPALVNAVSGSKGYTPLHQAAWHGANLSIVGALLAYGADRNLVTKDGKTARDIAHSRHSDREDLQYVLSPRDRSLAQLLRKLIAETPRLFSDYDGNRLICDRLIACLGETWDEDRAAAVSDVLGSLTLDLDARVEAALRTITGLSLPLRSTAHLVPAEHFQFSATIDFFHHTVVPLLRNLATRATCIPLEPHWTVLADLFELAPKQWGLRGDLFLWMELRQVLCHCELASTAGLQLGSRVEDRLTAAIATLTGTELGARRDVYVRRYARGGMSSGMVALGHWQNVLIPLLIRRASWLQESWTDPA